MYLDYPANALYALPALGPGEEFQLDTIKPKRIRAEDGKQQALILAGGDPSKTKRYRKRRSPPACRLPVGAGCLPGSATVPRCRSS